MGESRYGCGHHSQVGGYEQQGSGEHERPPAFCCVTNQPITVWSSTLIIPVKMSQSGPQTIPAKIPQNVRFGDK